MEKLYYPLHHRFVEGDMKSTIYFLDPTVLCKNKDLVLFLNSWYLEYIKGNEQKFDIPRGKGKKNWRKYVIGQYSPNTTTKHQFDITSNGIKVIKILEKV